MSQSCLGAGSLRQGRHVSTSDSFGLLLGLADFCRLHRPHVKDSLFQFQLHVFLAFRLLSLRAMHHILQDWAFTALTAVDVAAVGGEDVITFMMAFL